MRRFAPTLLLLLGACTTGNRGMVTTHQPIVKGDTAYVPGCPDWSTASAQAHEGQSSNYGCATMINLAAMIANPQDLLHGRSDAAGTGDVATKAIKAWREAVPTSKLWTTTTSVAPTSGGGK